MQRFENESENSRYCTQMGKTAWKKYINSADTNTVWYLNNVQERILFEFLSDYAINYHHHHDLTSGHYLESSVPGEDSYKSIRQ